MNLSSVDLHYLIKEMQFLVKSRIDKIYHPNKEELVLQFHVPSKGKKLLRIISGKFMFLSEHKGRTDQPSGFCMFLRKNLANARLREISQIGIERIAVLVFEKEQKYKLYIELFGKGNIVLCDEKNTILNALNQKKWADREIKKGVLYKYPKKNFDFKISKEEFSKIIQGNLVIALAKNIGVGGKYAEEICEKAGVDKNKKKLSDSELNKVYKAFRSIINKKDTKFNVNFDNFYKQEHGEEFVSKHQAMIDKIKKIISEQELQMKNLEKKSLENNKKGELIYENYQKIEEILKEINKAKEKYSFDEIKKKLKGHKIIKNIDAKNKKIVIDL